MTDHAPGIEDVVARRAGVPFGVDRILMRERPPVHFLLVHSILEVLGLELAHVDADQGERFVLQLRDERPLVGPTGPSGQSDVLPEIQEHDLAAVVAQFEANAVLIRSLDRGRLLADSEVANRE